MAYQKTEWKTGDVVTAEKLNKMENGISDSVLCIVSIIETFDESTGDPIATTDKTWQEIFDMVQNDKIVVFRGQYEYIDDDTGETIDCSYGFVELQGIGYTSDIEGAKSYYINTDTHTLEASDPNEYPIDVGQK